MLPDPDQFLNMVSKMRRLQKEYFKTRNKTVLQESINAEREVDEAIGIFEKNYRQKLVYNKFMGGV